MVPETATALEHRFARHRADLLAFLRRRVHPDLAEEMAQEAWLRILRAGPSCEVDEVFRAYVFTVARRLVIDHRRRQARLPVPLPLEDGGALVAWGPEHQLRADDVLHVVQAELSAMKPELAEVFRWRTTEDVRFHEIARRQGVSLNTALGRMHRAVKRIAAALRASGLVDLTRGGA